MGRWDRVRRASAVAHAVATSTWLVLTGWLTWRALTLPTDDAWLVGDAGAGRLVELWFGGQPWSGLWLAWGALLVTRAVEAIHLLRQRDRPSVRGLALGMSAATAALLGVASQVRTRGLAPIGFEGDVVAAVVLLDLAIAVAVLASARHDDTWFAPVPRTRPPSLQEAAFWRVGVATVVLLGLLGASDDLGRVGVRDAVDEVQGVVDRFGRGAQTLRGVGGRSR